MPNAHKNLSLALAPLLLSLMLLAPGCGVFSDLARDNQLHIGSLGLKDFISPVKLRVGILDLRDEVGLGSPEAGSNLAVLLTERFSENGDLVLVTPAEVSAAARARGWNGEELSPEMAMELGRELDLNVIMEGAISQVEQQAARRGWRRLIRFITDQQKYVDAVITLVAYDSATGLVISSRAGEGSYKVGQSEVDPFATTPEPAISQEAIEQGLELAIDDTYYRTLDGLAYTPFKAMVVSQDGKNATIRYGQNVGLPRGLEFVCLSARETLTSSINISYVVPGEAKARLVARDVGPDQATLEIVEGSLDVGDFVQAWDR